jgi:predicted porin
MMKKSILAIAVASLAVSTAAMAESTVYGNVHLSLNQADNDIDGADNNLAVSSNTSSIGVKGSEDLGDGMKAIYQLEWEVVVGPGPTTDPDADFVDGNTATNAFKGRDQFVGLKGGFGTIKFGTMSSNYKQMGGKVDPLYRTPFEGRGFLATQSGLHGGKGMNRGRETHTAQYTSPKFSGIQLVANTTFSGSNDETSGIGVRWSNKDILVYVDYITGQGTTAGQAGVQDCVAPCETNDATKIGGKFDIAAFTIGAQYEMSADRAGADYGFLAGTWNINSNNAVILTYGMQDVDEPAGVASQDTTGVALAYNHNLSKMTNVYVGYGAKSSDVDKADESMLSFGIKKKF